MKSNKIELSLYLIIIGICSTLASIIVSICYNELFIKVYGVMLLGIVIVIIVDGLTAGLYRLLPEKFADFTNKFYTVKKREKNFYEKLKIKVWKEKIPEIGHFTGFRKNQISEPNNPEYIRRFLIEICYGESGHILSVFTGFLLLVIPWFKPIWLPLALVIAIVNGILNLMPVMVLRYNSYTLQIIYNRLSRRNKTN